MAGDVSVQVIQGNLYVIGDDADNRVEILGTGVPGQVLMRAIDIAPLVRTEINGSELTTIGGITGDIIVLLKGGNDGLKVSNFVAPGKLIVDMSTGNDVVALGNYGLSDGAGGQFHGQSLVVKGEVQLNLGSDPNDAGNDLVGIDHTYAQGRLLAVFGGGLDEVGIEASSATELALAFGELYDLVTIADSWLTNVATINLGNGNDFVDLRKNVIAEQSLVLGNGGDDTVAVESAVFGTNAYFDLGSGNDQLALTTSRVDDFLMVFGGAGNDEVDAQIVAARVLNFDAGEDGDLLIASGSAFDEFYAVLGNGDDRANVYASLLRRGGLLLAGAGTDSHSAALIPTVSRTDFEIANAVLAQSITLRRAPQGAILGSTGTIGATSSGSESSGLIVVNNGSLNSAAGWIGRNGTSSGGLIIERTSLNAAAGTLNLSSSVTIPTINTSALNSAAGFATTGDDGSQLWIDVPGSNQNVGPSQDSM